MTTEPVVMGKTTLSTEEAAHLLGVSADCLWRAARNGDAPVPSFKVGRRLVWPTAPIRRLLGLENDDADLRHA